MAIAVGNFDAQFRPDSLLAQAWARVGATAAPTNQAAGDLTVSRLFVTDGALDSEARIAQIIDAYTPGAGAFNTMYVKTNITPAAMTATDEQRSAKFEVNVRPTANYAGTATGFYAEADHDSGAFNIATVQGFFTQAIHSVAATTVTTLRAARVAYRPNLGTTTTAVGLEITRGLSADAGTLGTGIGLLISASDTVIPTTDIAIQSLGGTHRFVGGLNLGSNADPATGNLLDIHGNAVIDNESVIRSRDAGGTIRDLFKMGSDDIVSFFVAGAAPRPCDSLTRISVLNCGASTIPATCSSAVARWDSTARLRS